MKNKKILMIISAVMILIFHLWIYIFNNNAAEMFIKQICFIGVDIFFFLSAYIIGKKEKINYKEFIFDRFKKIYTKFIIFSILACIYKGWSFIKFIKIITGIEFIIKGGGSFLWFIPAIMILYLLLPIYKNIEKKHPIISFNIIILIYIIVSIICLLTDYNNLFIFINRTPIILIGYYFGTYRIIEKIFSHKNLYYSISILLFIIGGIIAYYIYVNHINDFIVKDVFYLTSIPLIISLILLFNLIPESNMINRLGGITLEVYAIQMIFGYSLTSKIYNLFNNALITNVLSIISVILISIIFNKMFNFYKLKLNRQKS